MRVITAPRGPEIAHVESERTAKRPNPSARITRPAKAEAEPVKTLRGTASQFCRVVHHGLLRSRTFQPSGLPACEMADSADG